MVRRRPSVLHYVQTWLEPSAQFVHAQVSRSRVPAVVVAALGRTDEGELEVDQLTSLRWVHQRMAPGPWQRRLRTALLLGLVARHRVGLVHVHFGYRLEDTLGLVSRRRLRWVVSLHGHDVTALLADHPGHYRATIHLVDAVIVPSQHFAGVVADRLGVEDARIRVIPSGVDTERFQPQPLPPDPVVTFVGRFVEKKGLDVLLTAWRQVVAEVPGAELRLVGYGPLEGLADGAGPSVRVVARPPRDAIAGHIAAARVVVSPSRTAGDGDVETLLVVNLEAQASGRPVVTTNHGGIPEYVRDGETALVVPEGDPRALTDALVRLLTDEDLCRRLGQAGPGWAQRFSADRQAAEVDDLYSELLGPG